MRTVSRSRQKRRHLLLATRVALIAAQGQPLLTMPEQHLTHAAESPDLEKDAPDGLLHLPIRGHLDAVSFRAYITACWRPPKTS
jgi:hypothetical protein